MAKTSPTPIPLAPTTNANKIFPIPVIRATAESIQGYGHIVSSSPETFPIEIVRWPAQGWRPVDANSGDQGGVTEGLFEVWWEGETLYGKNNAVGGSYLFGWSQLPENPNTKTSPQLREKVLTWLANYHPDGGQLFYPLDNQSFIIPLALPGDDITPSRFKAFLCDGSQGLYIHPNIWHGAVTPINADRGRFMDRQGRVHACVSVDFTKEFGGYLSVPLRSVRDETSDVVAEILASS